MNDASVDGAPSARERAYRYLRQAIISGEIPAGTRIVEERVAESLRLSRTPVREALQRLGTEGLVNRIRRGHLEVAAVSEAERGELRMVRVAIDEVVARLLARKTATVDWPKLYALLDPLDAAVSVGGAHSPTYALAHLQLHMAINDAAFSRRAALMLGGRAGLYPTDDYVQQDGYEPVTQHRQLLDALAGGDENTAVTMILAHALRGAPARDPAEPGGLAGEPGGLAAEPGGLAVPGPPLETGGEPGR
jgi:DNA-binding GntR family transcriptional regulator